MAQTPTSRIEDPSPALAARLVRPFAHFAQMGAAPGIVLLACAVIALVWANSAWSHVYHELVHVEVGFAVGGFDITKPSEWWINDALMAVFFFVVGLEIKREILIGELRSPRAAALPVIAAVGGMLAPGVIYACVNWGQPTVRGWGVPTATDIAFALGVLALLGKMVPAGLRVFLATLAIADDIGALLVIAMFYTERLETGFLLYAGAALAAMVALNVSGVRRAWIYWIAGLFLWWFVYRSGVHATIAGVLGAMTIPSRSRVNRHAFAAFTRSALRTIEAEQDTPLHTSASQQAAVQGIEDACQKVQTPMQSLEHALVPWVSFLIVPVFALANAGVALTGGLAAAFTSPETLGIVLGLCVGKPLGITLFSLLAVKTGIGRLPSGVTPAMLHAAAWIAGIGFTMSLFIANLAFPGATHPSQLDHAKIGVLAGSTVAGLIGLALLWHATRRRGA
ncbi:MAG TPA: Na+/H+ antiporter NhaA [Phycisphaerales bacterium]|nr:Na+/H+ antiporter NhaA [Phycisphaerales bacterium]